MSEEITAIKRFQLFLRDVEKRYGLGPVAAAEKCGYHSTYYFKVRGGVRRPSRDFMDTLAQEFGLSPIDHARGLVILGYLPHIDDTFREAVALMAATWGLRVKRYEIKREPTPLYKKSAPGGAKKLGGS